MDENKKSIQSNSRVVGRLKGFLWKRPSSAEALLNDDADADSKYVVSDYPLFDLSQLYSRSYRYLDWSQDWRLKRQEFNLVTGCQYGTEGRGYERGDWMLAQVEVRAAAASEVDDAAVEDNDAAPEDEEDEVVDNVFIEGAPTHLIRHIILGKGEIQKPLVRKLLMSGHVCTLGLPWTDVAEHLPSLLDALPSSSPLRHLFIYLRIVDTDVEFEPLNVLCKCASLGFVDGVVIKSNESVLLPSSQLDALRSSLSYYGVLDRPSTPSDATDADKNWGGMGKVKQLQLRISDINNTGLKPFTSLTRVDLRDDYFWPDLDLRSVLDVLMQCTSLTDVGLPLMGVGAMKTLLESGLHTRVATLRIFFMEIQGHLAYKFVADRLESAWKMLLQGLQHSASTVQFLDCHFSLALSDAKFTLSLPNTISVKALRFQFGWTLLYDDFLMHLPEFLRSSNLLYLDVDGPYQLDLVDNWEWANALINNFYLCSLSLPWKIPAAEAHAALLIRRNQLYRTGKLLKEPLVQPNTAKLFVCGHTEVGKTTLCRALQLRMREECPKWLPSSFICGTTKPEPDRTRGMEFHHLSFEPNGKRLLICDLAGQEEYHVFHHYFMNASNNDVFLVVCKFDRGCLALQAFQQKLEYWLRFIISHKSARSKVVTSVDSNVNDGRETKPKVVVVVNFFYQSRDPTELGSITNECALNVMNKFSHVLDFALVAGGESGTYRNLFGVNAKTAIGVYYLKLRLKALLQHFADSAWPIPKLCYDLSAKLTYEESPGTSCSWLCPSFFAAQQKEPRLLTSCAEVFKLLIDTSHEDSPTHTCTRVQAALQELHNQGFVVFFPPSGSIDEAVPNSVDKFMSSLVITDISWFCNKLVGSLLGTHIKGEPRRDCPWVWSKNEIRIMLLTQGCKKEHLAEILRYLENLELCISLADSEKGSLLFPALARAKVIKYPNLIMCKMCNTTSVHFFGRRIRCADSAIHLVPFGVFTRLQVKLHKEYCVYDESFELGYGWVSFLKGNVGVVVRFGSGDVNEAWESKQWVDILIFCPGSCNGCAASTSSRLISDRDSCHTYVGKPMDHPSFVGGSTVMDGIKNLIQDTCKSDGFGGIPMVKLEEWVLQSKDSGAPAILLSTIMEKVRKEGLQESHQEWAVHIGSTPVIDLLLPTEIEDHVKLQLHVLEVIEEEFTWTRIEDAETNGAVDELKPGSRTKQQLEGPWLELWGRVESMQRRSDDRNQKRWEKVDRSLQLVRDDIRNLSLVLRQAERNIIDNCSTRLLRRELRQDRAYPLYPYLVDAQGKLAPLWRLLGKRAVVHFMCESPTEGPHPLQGQKGKEVMLEVKEWVAKVARVVVPAVKIICLLARVAASVYLPSVHVFMPSPEGLVSGLGLEKDTLQHVILPQALEALLGQLPSVNHMDFLTERGSKIDEKEVKDVMQALLQKVQVDMASDFGLQRVIFDEVNGNSFWVCENHVHNGKHLSTNPNPYQT